ncbi:MAG: hypothetical protein C4518_14465 [Desulfobacteraceae bacterium]|nr:MAG: hypothetical protein C4518_14465 [Desulfobacteraceae bacterium]
MKNAKKFITIAVFSIVLGGCASDADPTAADYMRGHASELQTEVDLKDELAREWDRGARLIETGERHVQLGEDQVAEGKENIERGNQEILEGRMLIENSERTFNENFPTQKIKP